MPYCTYAINHHCFGTNKFQDSKKKKHVLGDYVYLLKNKHQTTKARELIKVLFKIMNPLG